MKAILTVGVSGSGKSTWAKEEEDKHFEDTIRVERDEIRRDLFQFGQWKDYKFTRAKENRVTEVANKQIKDAAQDGYNIIISDTNLNQKYREALVDQLEAYGYNVELKEFPVTWDEAVKFNGNREYSVSIDVLNRQWKDWLKFIDRKVYIPDEDLTKAIIFDVDGTLAEMDGRGPFEWDRVGEDKPRTAVIDMLLGYQARDYSIIVLSGRDGVCSDATIQWLEDNGVWADAFYMRAAGDCRKDTIIKEELFWEYLADQYNVQAVVDDRPCVCRMWRDLGLPVWQVADPYQEF